MLKRSTREFDLFILRQLADTPSYGYGLAKTLSKDRFPLHVISQSSIYHALRRLERTGLISGTLRISPKNPHRLLYAPTNKGRLVLQQESNAWQETLLRRIEQVGHEYRRLRWLLGNI